MMSREPDADGLTSAWAGLGETGSVAPFTEAAAGCTIWNHMLL